MRKVLHSIRQKPPEFRLAISLVLALALTGIVAAFWISNFFHQAQPDDQSQVVTSDAPTPFQSLVSTVKQSAGDLKMPKLPTAANATTAVAAPTNSVQVIDAGAANDESNPADASSTTN